MGLGLFCARILFSDRPANKKSRGNISFMQEATLVVEKHQPLVERFLSAIAEDFRITEAIARNASVILSRQETRRAARGE